ncbi:MAG: efflux RND transporter permease subunit [Planctomycetota bacterium]
MQPIAFALRKPVTVMVGVLLVVLFGTLALVALPVQLVPDVDKTILTVKTEWEGASPFEVEQEILYEQERRLKSIPGLDKMTSTAARGSGTVELEFGVGMDKDRALLDASDKLRQVQRYPENVDQPVLSAGETQGASAIAWFVLQRTADSPYAPDDLPLLRTMIVEDVQPILERATDVAQVGIYGGIEREVHVEVDAAALAARELTLLTVRDAIRAHNIDVSAGELEDGKRTMLVRTVGKFTDLHELSDLVLVRRQGEPIRLSDVARVRIGYKEPTSMVRALGSPSIAVNATKQSGSNVLEVMASLQEKVAEVNDTILRPKGVELVQVYDQTIYIDSAIDLVVQNLWVGGLLAIGVLFLFLRSVGSTFVIGLAIPVSVLGGFLGLAALGRTINVVSLAGMAFAVGMVVDNSIVVLENIDRRRSLGERGWTAALEGAKEVWGAVLASTLTTLAVFLPVVFMQEEAGQLFRDIAIAISSAVLLSLFVSVLFIPMAASRLLKRHKVVAEGEETSRFAGPIADLAQWLQGGLGRRLATVFGLTGASLALSWLMLPPMAYLPGGNQNLIIGFMITPPGYSMSEFERIGEHIEKRLRPYFVALDEDHELAPELRRPAWYQGPQPLPGITNFFFVTFGSSVFMGARSDDDRNVRPLMQLMTYAAAEIPGVMFFPNQASLFERGLSSSNSIDLEVQGYDWEQLKGTTQQLQYAIAQRFGWPRSDPGSYDLGAPELRLELDQARALELGVSTRDLGYIVNSMVDGAIVSDYLERGIQLDVKIPPMVRHEGRVEDLEQVPVWTPAGGQVPLASLAHFVETNSPTCAASSSSGRSSSSSSRRPGSRSRSRWTGSSTRSWPRCGPTAGSRRRSGPG